MSFSAAVLRSVDQLQAAIQAKTSKCDRTSWGGLQRAMRSAWQIAEAEYPHKCLGIGSSRLTIAFGGEHVAKINWHGDAKATRKASTFAQKVEGNLRQAAFWLSLNDEQAQLVCPLLLLSKGGVLWAQRARPVAPPFNPLRHLVSFKPEDMKLHVLRETERAIDELGAEQEAARQRYGDAVLRVRREINGVRIPNIKRMNNYGWVGQGHRDSEIVLIDVIHKSRSRL